MIEFAPFTGLPWQRRMQTFTVLVWIYTLFFCLALSALLYINPLTLPLMLMYTAWIYLDKAPTRGGRRIVAFQRAKWWHFFRDFFPVQLHKTADLDPNKNYVFGYHPHGIIGIGLVTNFGTDSTGFSATFPGITMHPMTLKINFKIPFFRECLMALGFCEVSKESCNYILSKKGTGNAICIVVGGAQEALDAYPGTNTLTLAERKGFVRVALQNGASLVPVFSFGENDVYFQAEHGENSRLRTSQERLKKWFGFSLPLFYGRGVFQYTFGWIPHRIPINTVVGKPIDVPRVENPTDAQVNELHAKYVEELKKLFNEHKSRFAMNRRRSIVIA